MASTIAIAASFQIDPEKLEAWAKGDKPTDEKEIKICNEIFDQFQFVDGEWSPIKTKAKKTKTTKAKGKKKGTKKAASTTDSEAASNKYNTESIVSEKASSVEVSSDLPERAEVAQSDKSISPTEETDLTVTDSITDTKRSSKDKKAKSTKTLKKSAVVVEEELQPTNQDATDKTTTSTEAQQPGAKSKPSNKTAASDKPVETKDGSKDKSDSVKSDEDKEAEEFACKVYFTAVGMIRAEVKFDNEGNQHTVKFGGKIYPLFYARKNYHAFTGLKKEIETTGNSTQRLIVYPKFTHFPQKEQPPRVGFQLIGFDKGAQPEGIGTELKDNEFKLCGIWQFIPVCRQPSISVFRNFTRERLDYIKQAEVQSKVNFMKASHLPVLWRDGPVKPFRFNPKAAKEEQAKTYFVQIKAKFLPQRDCFGFSEMLADPIEKPPKFLKASKADKAEAMKGKKPAGGSKPGGRG